MLMKLHPKEKTMLISGQKREYLNTKVTIPGCSYKVTLLEIMPHIESYRVFVEGKDCEGIRFLTYAEIHGYAPIDWNFDIQDNKRTDHRIPKDRKSKHK